MAENGVGKSVAPGMGYARPPQPGVNPNQAKPPVALAPIDFDKISQMENPAEAFTVDIVKRLFCPTATNLEAMAFISTCKTLQLNPLIREAYLIKYDAGKPAQLVVSKDVLAKRADIQPDYRGFQSGLILIAKTPEATVEEVEGAYFNEATHRLDGGWCVVEREGRKPVVVRLRLTEYNKHQSTWNALTATMIRKTAFGQAHREAYPNLFSQMYLEEEFNVVNGKSVIDGEGKEVSAEAQAGKEDKAISPANEAQVSDLLVVMDARDVPPNLDKEVRGKIANDQMSGVECEKLTRLFGKMPMKAKEEPKASEPVEKKPVEEKKEPPVAEAKKEEKKAEDPAPNKTEKSDGEKEPPVSEEKRGRGRPRKVDEVNPFAGGIRDVVKGVANGTAGVVPQEKVGPSKDSPEKQNPPDLRTGSEPEEDDGGVF